MTSTQTAPYVVVPASPVLGAEIVGVDLADGVDDVTAEALTAIRGLTISQAESLLLDAAFPANPFAR